MASIGAPAAIADTGCPLAESSYNAGAGTSESPFVISTPGHLQRIKETSSDWDKFFRINNDINMSGCVWSSPIGTDALAFTGSFSGIGRFMEISGLSVNVVTAAPDSGQNSGFAGLFGKLGTGHVISNFAFEGSVSNTTSSTSTFVNAGGIAGSASGGTIRDVTFRGTVTASISVNSTTGARAGGLVGTISGTQTIDGSFVVSSTITASGADPTSGGLVGRQATISSDSLTIVESAAANSDVIARDQYSSGGSIAGGLVGFANGIVTATDSYATGVITVRNPLFVGLHAVLGGIVGYANQPATLTRTFASTSLFVVDPQAGVIPRIGGLVGSMTGGNLSGSYWNADAARATERAVGDQSDSVNVGRTASAAMQNPTSFSGWTLTNAFPPTMWGICESQSLPYLVGQTSGSPCFVSGPQITGSPVIGATLSAIGIASPGAYELIWGQVVVGDAFFGKAGATDATYIVTSQDLGDRLAVRAFRMQDGISVATTSAATAPVTNPSPPSPGGGQEPQRPIVAPVEPPAIQPVLPAVSELIVQEQSLPATYKIPRRIKAGQTSVVTRRAMFTNADQRVRIAIKSIRVQRKEYRVIRRANGYVAIQSLSNKPIRITITWGAPATEDYRALRFSRTYRTR